MKYRIVDTRFGFVVQVEAERACRVGLLRRKETRKEWKAVDMNGNAVYGSRPSVEFFKSEKKARKFITKVKQGPRIINVD